MAIVLPRGVRNNNPGNIRWGEPWQGLVKQDERTDSSFCQFVHSTYGIRAICRVIISYQDKYRLYTVRDIINRWAPPVENDTTAYVNIVAQNMGVKPDAKLNVHEYATLKALVNFIIKHENGRGPLKTDNSWYSDDIIDKGLTLAGVEPQKSKLPINPETIAATSIGVIGVSEIVSEISDGVSTGNNAKTALIIAVIIFAVIIVISQLKKRHDNVA